MPMISQLPPIVALNGTEIIPATQGTDTFRITASQLAAFSSKSFTGLTGEVTSPFGSFVTTINKSITPVWLGTHAFGAGILVSFGQIPPAPNNPNVVAQFMGIPGVNSSGIQIDGFGNTATVYARRANGTPAAPTAIKSGDFLGGLNTPSFDGSIWSPGVRFQGMAIADWTPSSHSSAAVISAASATNSAAAPVAFFYGSGGASIGPTVADPGAGNLAVPNGVAVGNPGGGAIVGAVNAKAYYVDGTLFTGGGPGGGGLTVVPNLAALAALSPSVVAAYVADPVLNGIFLWNPGDLTVDVANDPGQGITVARSSDITGASGGWVRQYVDRVNLRWWLFKGDGTPTVDPFGNLGTGPIVGTGTDNGVPFVNFCKWARGQYTAGKFTRAKLDPGYYLWNGSTQSPTGTSDYRNFAGWGFAGVNNIDIDMYGATIQQTYNETVSGANGAASCPLPFPLHDSMHGYLIANTVPGTNTFTLLNVADVATSNIKPGTRIALACQDQQYEAPPPNSQQFTFFTVKSISGATVTTVETINEAFRTDFVDTLAFFGGGELLSGAARMWVFDQTGVNAWQGRFILRGGQVNLAPGLLSPGKYVTLAKENYETYDWYGVGFSESEIADGVHYNAAFFTAGEIDKAIGRLTYYNILNGALNIQSAFPGVLNVYGGNFGSVNTGSGKRTLVQGAKLASIGAIAPFGLNTSSRYVECEIGSVVGTFGLPVDGARLMPMSAIASFGAISANSGYNGGVTRTFTNVPLTGGSGTTTALANITVTAGVVTQIILSSYVTGGLGYVVGDVLSAASANLGGNTGTTFTVPVATVAARFEGTTAGLIQVDLTNLGQQTTAWGIVVGQWINLQAKSSGATLMFSNDVGSGLILNALWLINSLGTVANGTLAQGSGYVDGTYNYVPLTGGSPTGAQAFANIVVSGGKVTSAVPVTGISQIFAFNAPAGGSGYVSGTYLNVPLVNVNGAGAGATANITVVGGVVQNPVVINNPGKGYAIGSTLNTPNTNLGGSGSGFTVTIQSLANGGFNYQVGDVLTTAAANLGGSGSGFSVNVTQMLMNLVTTLPYTALPAFASGNLYKFSQNELELVNCQGADLVRQASEAYKNGQRYYEYRKVTFAGAGANATTIGLPTGCLITEIQVNVRQAHATVPTAVLNFSMSTVATPTFVNDTFPGIQVTVQVGVIGTRTWTQTAATGINPTGATLDKLQVGGVTQPLLPSNRLISSTGAIQLFSFGQYAGTSPIGDIIIKTSAGMIRYPLPKQFDESGSLTTQHMLIVQQGGIP